MSLEPGSLLVGWGTVKSTTPASLRFSKAQMGTPQPDAIFGLVYQGPEGSRGYCRAGGCVKYWKTLNNDSLRILRVSDSTKRKQTPEIFIQKAEDSDLKKSVTSDFSLKSCV